MNIQKIRAQETLEERLPIARKVADEGGDFEELGKLFGTTAFTAKCWLRYKINNSECQQLHDRIDEKSGIRREREKQAKALRAAQEAEKRARVLRLAKTLNCSPAHAEKAIKRYSLASQASSSPTPTTFSQRRV